MTREEMIRLTGFQMVGEGRRLVGRGVLFGFPVEAVRVNVLVRNHLALFFFVDKPLTRPQIRALRKRLKETEDLRKHVSVTTLTKHLHPIAEQSFFSVEIAFKGEEPQQLYNRAIRATEVAIKEAGIPHRTSCSCCGLSEGDALARWDGRLQIVHMACLRKWKGAVQEELEQRQYTTGYAQGLIGGLLGGAVALAIVLATMFYEILHEFLGLSGIVFPVGIFFGWKLFGGKHNRVAVIFTISYALVLSAISAMVNTYRLHSAMFPDDTTVQDVIIACLSPSLLLGDFMIQSLAAWVMVAIGFGIIWARILTTNKWVATKTEAITDDATLLSERIDDRLKR